MFEKVLIFGFNMCKTRLGNLLATDPPTIVTAPLCKIRHYANPHTLAINSAPIMCFWNIWKECLNMGNRMSKLKLPTFTRLGVGSFQRCCVKIMNQVRKILKQIYINPNLCLSFDQYTLKWDSNDGNLVKRNTSRMLQLNKLCQFGARKEYYQTVHIP